MIGDVLEGVSSRTAVPYRRRREFLRELQHDVESLTDDLRAEGLPYAEAKARARALLLPDPDSLDRWTEVHEPAYARIRRRLDERRLRRFERGVFGGVVATSTLLGVGLLSRIEVFRDPSPFLVPLVVLGGLLFATCLHHAVLLWARGKSGAARRTLWWILFLCAGILAFAVAGVVADLIRLFAGLQQDPSRLAESLTTALRRESTLLAVALLQAMGGAVFWLFATQWLAISEDALARALLDTRQSIFREQER